MWLVITVYEHAKLCDFCGKVKKIGKEKIIEK